MFDIIMYIGTFKSPLEFDPGKVKLNYKEKKYDKFYAKKRNS